MARPIKETPVLRGRDAVQFEAKVSLNASRDHTAEYQRAKAEYSRVTRGTGTCGSVSANERADCPPWR